MILGLSWPKRNLHKTREAEVKVCQSLSESLFTVRYSVSCNQKGSVNALARSPRSRRFSACFCSKGSHLQLFFRSLLPAYLLFSCSVVSNSATPRTAACQAALFSTVSQSLLKLMSIESVMPSNHLILSPSLSSSPQSFPASGSFPMCRLASMQSTGASAPVLPMNIQG